LLFPYSTGAVNCNLPRGRKNRERLWGEQI
jgi:hypothetical protein